VVLKVGESALLGVILGGKGRKNKGGNFGGQNNAKGWKWSITYRSMSYLQ